MANSISDRNSTLDIVKIIASFFVVFIHVPFPGEFGTAVKAFSGFAVPLFFIISGYYSYNLIVNENYKKLFSRVISLLRLLIISLAVYSALYLVINGIEAYVSYLYTIKTYIVFFVFTNFENEFFTPLWFLPALIYCYIVMMVLTRIKMTKLIRFMPLLLLVNVVLTDFVFKKYECSAIITRNFLITGCPFFSLGFLAKENEESLEKKSSAFYAALLGVCFILFLAFYLVLKTPTAFVFTFAAILFLLSLKTRKAVNSPFLTSVLSDLSTYIYVSHWAIWICVSLLGLSENNPLSPIVVLIISIAVSMIISVFLFLFRKKQNRKILK